ncbi:hypothetical protein [Paenirhodobacter sp.]|uniref:hypothetical protein n=1 Tax=Paenirhodobacter sp. TaxID=1965326 RepID=UPI003B3F3272
MTQPTLGNPSIVAVSKLLSDLPAKAPNDAERDFRNEAISCYKVKAYRSAIVMAWNLTCDHLTSWLLADAHEATSECDEFCCAINHA